MRLRPIRPRPARALARTLALFLPSLLHAQPAGTPTGWFGGAHLGATIGNYEIEHVANVGAGAFDLGGAVGVSGGYLWRRVGFAVGGELQQLVDQTDRGDFAAPAIRSAPGLVSGRVDVLVPLSWSNHAPGAFTTSGTQRLMLVGGVHAARFDGALGVGNTDTPVAGVAEVRGVGWSLGGQWLRALGETRWLVADARLERFRVTSGEVAPAFGQSAVRTPSGRGTTFVMRLGARVMLPTGRE